MTLFKFQFLAKSNCFHFLCVFLLLITAFGLLNSSCSKPPAFQSLTEADQFKYGKEQIRRRHYSTSIQWFDRFVRIHSGSAVRDSAMYLLGQAHFGLEEYLLAAAEFERLVKDLPNSLIADAAMYQAAMSYYKMSPSYEHDQANTVKAIEKFQRLTEDYPNSKYVPAANKGIADCRSKLARKTYKNGELYQKLEDYDAAIIYFDNVEKLYFDTEWAALSLFGKGICYVKKKDIPNAKQAFQEFLTKYPTHAFARDVREKLSDISREKKPPQETKTTSR
jgi:outer membrane protein assembly factor BamD